MTLYRIGTDTPSYTADDRSGIGVELAPGRWNAKGTPVLYTSTSRALACLETLVHTAPAGAFPFNRYLVEITVPADVWRARARCRPADTNVIGWDAIPAGLVSRAWGQQWLMGGHSLLAEVPSVVVPEESNVLINPRHAHAGRITTRKVRKWLYDPRFWNPSVTGS
ncbi:MAG: RES family NAD+ phosphorylase [Gemmatimonas sp.]|nr:RES family NAD+ phosphorylase [Gemmatimonas sp.]